jgi:DNA-binding response OmpR family regulator
MNAGRTRILCIEDDRETAALIVEALGEYGYDVEVAHDGRAGLDAIYSEPPDMVLADVSLPLLSGFQLLERLSALAPRFATMPVVLLTALADRQSELRGWRLGADDYVTKPVDFEILRAVIDTRLRRVGHSRAATVTTDLREREIQALTWVARGKTSSEIAQILGLSKRTVDFHVDNARIKLGVATRTQAVLKATSGHLIAP